MTLGFYEGSHLIFSHTPLLGPLTEAAAQGPPSGQALLHDPPFWGVVSIPIPSPNVHMQPGSRHPEWAEMATMPASPSLSQRRHHQSIQHRARADSTHRWQQQTPDPDPSSSRARPQASTLTAAGLGNRKNTNRTEMSNKGNMVQRYARLIKHSSGTKTQVFEAYVPLVIANAPAMMSSEMYRHTWTKQQS